MRKLQINETSKFKGVCYSYHQASYKAQIMVGSKNLHLGYYSSEDTAKMAYDYIKGLGLECVTGVEARKLLALKGIKED